MNDKDNLLEILRNNGDLNDVKPKSNTQLTELQFAERLTELKKARSIIRVCKRVLWFLLVHEIKSTSTRREVETLLKNITEYSCQEE